MFKSTTLEANDKSFYELKINDISGNKLNLKDYRNKIILLVNTASYCGFTKQYDDLQIIWDKYKKNGLIVLGTPSNTFNQEKKTNNEVKEFCEFNFNLTFPITEIISVKGENAHPLYIWAKKNFGNSAVPKWNFHKILINKNGKIVETYASFTKPTSKKIISKIEELID